ncbi:MAG: DUF6314 family protein [Pseudomonadota bacterium]|jgi:hypothetical protein|nr:DUF6314 family protein [Pseudomonadota bacterium]
MPELAAFEGDWLLERQISDALAGAAGRFDGQARFAPGADGLIYDEEGVLHLPGQPPMAATRRYLWRAEAAGIAVFFDDGRPFHGFGSTGTEQATHHCGPDLYQVRYDFSDWPRWRTLWRVTGPRKDYVMRSTYRRPGD